MGKKFKDDSCNVLSSWVFYIFQTVIFLLKPQNSSLNIVTYSFIDEFQSICIMLVNYFIARFLCLNQSKRLYIRYILDVFWIMVYIYLDIY